MDAGADERAERLRVALAIFEGWPYVEPREAPLALSPAEASIARDADERDVELLNACIEVERELRECGYAALERLSAVVAGREGNLEERVRALPPIELHAALRDLYEVAMVYDAPTEP